MKNITLDIQLIEKTKETLGGVFDHADIANLFGEPHQKQLYRRLNDLIENGNLERFCRGVYITPKFDLEVLSQKISPRSYISFGSVLAEHLVIGRIPRYQLDAVKIGKTRVYKQGDYTVRHFGSKTSDQFGIKSIGGVRKADAERALIDTLYFYQHGTEFYFDIFSDIDRNRFDTKKIDLYLSQNDKNQKFVNFVKGFFE